MNPDESLLVVVTDTLGRTAWIYHIEPDGGLTAAEPFYHLELPDDVAETSRARCAAARDGMTFDSHGPGCTPSTKMGSR